MKKLHEDSRRRRLSKVKLIFKNTITQKAQRTVSNQIESDSGFRKISLERTDAGLRKKNAGLKKINSNNIPIRDQVATAKRIPKLMKYLIMLIIMKTYMLLPISFQIFS